MYLAKGVQTQILEHSYLQILCIFFILTTVVFRLDAVVELSLTSYWFTTVMYQPKYVSLLDTSDLKDEGSGQ